ncbi:MAG: thioredoxin family protein [Planctomycetales bacterium]|nr:thioredoxin family protein [Planctomycetales bacterium]
MVRTASTMLPLGTAAPEFSLPDYNGNTVSLSDCRGTAGLLVIFMCNHCPYVKHVAPEVSRLADEYLAKGVGVVGISSNDIANYPDDSPELMKKEAESQGYRFPYLVDETQSVAKAYHAACTPDFFLFDAELKLVYRGQLDDTRPRQGVEPNGEDLRAALEAMLHDEAIAEVQKPSVGCNIKWIAGAEPSYFNPSGSA